MNPLLLLLSQNIMNLIRTEAINEQNHSGEGLGRWWWMKYIINEELSESIEVFVCDEGSKMIKS